MDKKLSVRLDDRRVGVLAQDEHGQLSFTYLPEWIASPASGAVSMALPLQPEPFGDRAVRAFFEGFLPDDEQDLERIARHFGVSAKSTFQLVRALGGDLAGALSIHEIGEPLEREADREPAYELLDEPGLADLLLSLEREPLGAGPDGLRLSLAGAQSKTAVYLTDDGEIAKTRENYPSSHIIKPELRTDVPDVALLEYFSLEVARRVGLPVPGVEYGKAQGVPYVLIERYDRVRHDDGRIARLHQEDFCQALGVPPQRKYQSEGGPGLAACFELASRLRTPAVARLRLLDLVIFNWLIGNHDAHGKNFSVLYAPEGAELAPAYDVVSVLVYEQDPGNRQDPARMWNRNMAMRIGRVRLATDVTPEEWARFGKETGFVWSAIRQRIEALSRATVLQAVAVERRLAERSLTTPHFHRAVDLLIQHVERLRVEQKLGLLPAEGIPGRLKAVHFEETARILENVQMAGTADERLDFEMRYRRRMTKLWSDHDRARRAGRSDEDERLGEVGRSLTTAFGTWESGGALSDAEAELLRTHVGPLPGEPRVSPPVPAEQTTDVRPSLARGETDARRAAAGAETAAVGALGLAWPGVIVLTAVPARALDLRDQVARNNGPLQRLLVQPPRWRVGGWDLAAGRDLDRAEGRILRAATPGFGAIDVWTDGTLATAFEPRMDTVAFASGQALRLNGLELAERTYLFAEFVNAVFALDEVPVAAVQLGLRMRALRSGQQRLVLGPHVPGTYGWQFLRDLSAADADEVVFDAVMPSPLDAGRVAYQMLRDVYLAFGVTVDALPFLEGEGSGRSVSKTKFLDFVDRHRA